MVRKMIFGSLLSFGLLMAGCSSRMEDQSIEDKGKLQIGVGVYLKKFNVSNHGYGYDRVYLLVDENDKLISTVSNNNFTVSNGKSRITRSITAGW